jgi:hypothetical protein
VRIDGKPVVDIGKLSLGGALETGSSSGATITVADIGEVEVDPNTRIRLVKTQSDEHRLALDHGRMKATISAPPRLFFVDTPSAEAIDLGCARRDSESGWGLLTSKTRVMTSFARSRDLTSRAAATTRLPR